MSFRSTIVPLLLLAALAPLAGCDRHNAPAPQATPTGAVNADEAATPGYGAKPALPAAGKIDRSHKGEAAQGASFTDPSGKPVALANFKGKPVLLNLWATWCGPCVAEMPTLDQVAAGMTVVAVSQDLGTEGATKVKAFLDKEKLARIQPYTDPQATLSTAYQAQLPTSILYDSTGHEVWRTSGGMNWTTPDAKALLAEAR